MRTKSQSLLLLLAGVLAGAGCESQATWSVPNFAGGPGLSAAVVMGTPVGRERAAPHDEVATESAAGGDDVQPIVWRASSHPTGGDPLEDLDPVVHLPSPPPARAPHAAAPPPVPNELPRELNKVTMPPYRVEPPDVLVINALRVVPRPPYKIEPLDELLIQAPAAQVLPNEPISGAYPVGPDGRVDLGYSYGKVAVAGMAPEEARAAISKHVADQHGIKPPAVSVALRRTRAPEQVRGEHLVRMDGFVSLGGYGDVFVAGLTLAEVKQAVEAQLARALLNPEVTVDVAAANSKAYYVICDAGCAQQVIRRPLLGGETVLDAVSELHGLPAPPAALRVWIARPIPGQFGCRQMLPVDWAAITEAGAANTNYQLFPGDRVYVRATRESMAWGSGVSKVMAWFGH
jgi:polysaccharide export outer membrane protein